MKWFTRFLEGRFRASWAPLIVPALAGLDTLSTEPQLDDLVIVYDFMSEVAHHLLSAEKPIIEEVVDKIDLDPTRARKHAADPDKGRQVLSQLVFAAVGWLSKSRTQLRQVIVSVTVLSIHSIALLYDPEPVQPSEELVLKRPSGPTRSPRRLPRQGQTFTKFRYKFDKLDMMIFKLLENFGQVVPQVTEHGDDQVILKLLEKLGQVVPEAAEHVGDQKRIAVSYVCFHSLDRLGQITIEWVNTVSDHLEFDIAQRRLKVFRFPSYCLLMYRDSTLISKYVLDS